MDFGRERHLRAARERPRVGKGEERGASRGAIRPGRWDRFYQPGTNGTTGSLRRGRVVLIRRDGLRDGQAQLAEPQPERPPGDAEDPRGL